MIRIASIILVLLVSASAIPLSAAAQSRPGSVITGPSVGNSGTIDYGNARAMPLPISRTAPQTVLEMLLSNQAAAKGAGLPSVSPGRKGNGKLQPIQLAPAKFPTDNDGVQSQEFGTSGHPFTTSRANLAGQQSSRFYPYAAAGKLFFNIAADTYVCSASLIKRGLIVTAAHCVAQFGASRYYKNWRFVPGYDNGTAPFGTWTVAQWRVLPAYFYGTDSCTVFGIVCADDVAVLTLNPQAGVYLGSRTGYLGYGINGYSYNSSGQALITQLGYPQALDGGQLMQRTNSQGFISAADANNTIIGSLQTGGSSGGPWVVNLGMAPSLNGTSFGTAAVHNIVVGVTSWGYTSTTIKQQGASPFTSANIGLLVASACVAVPAACL